MTGREMHKILERTGIEGKKLAQEMGFPTPSRVYKASNSGASEVKTIYELAFEKILGVSRFNAMLNKIRLEDLERKLRAEETTQRLKEIAELKAEAKAAKKREREELRARTTHTHTPKGKYPVVSSADIEAIN